MRFDFFQNAQCQIQSAATVVRVDRRRGIVRHAVQKCGKFSAQRFDVVDFQAIYRNA